MSDHVPATGWAAIDASCQALYGDQEPFHWGTDAPPDDGVPHPLRGVSAFDAGDAWHYVSYGLSEVYGKESGNPELSGWGFEFSFRVTKAEAEPPVWPVGLLLNFARYVHQTGNVLGDGDYMPLHGPITEVAPTELVGALFVDDPSMPAVDTPNGRLAFRQLIAVTEGELLAAQQWNTEGVASLLRERGAHRTEVERASVADDPSFVDALASGSQRDGSRTGVTYVGEGLEVASLGKGMWEISVGAISVPSIRAVLPHRVPFDRPYMLASSAHRVMFRPGTEATCKDEIPGLAVELTPEHARELARILRPERGTYGIDGLPLIVVVEPTEIKDQEGKVVKVIG